MRIALDVHGGDVGVTRNVSAALETLDDPRVDLILVGDTREIEQELRRRHAPPRRFEIVHAAEKIGMSDAAALAIRSRPNNSITVSMELMRAGKVDAVVSAGHSGAVVAAALFTLGRIPGVSRPALGTRIPSPHHVAFALDIGAVIDPRPEVLLQFGYLGSAYARSVLDVPNPTVALLANGEEASKGNALVRAARELFDASSLNFVGYVEGRDLLSNPPHVTVTDGFTGNIALKTAEGTAVGIARILKQELTASPWSKLLALPLRPAFRRIREQIDFEGIGGAPLLGVNGVVIGAHGRSSTSALVNAIEGAAHAAEVQLPTLLRNAIPPRSVKREELVETDGNPTVAIP